MKNSHTWPGKAETVFFADLDNTLIYSYKREINVPVTWVEQYQGRDISFMTEMSWSLLQQVRRQALFVPATTRTVEQYQRITFGTPPPEYALVCNGGVLLVHGKKVVEGVPKGFSKATGIQVICEKLGLPHENTYAFGDSVNDLDMLKYVAHGIAMGNGMPEAKAAANYVTDDILEDGIYNACKHFGLI